MIGTISRKRRVTSIVSILLFMAMPFPALIGDVLPDPLEFLDGSPVSTLDEWTSTRRDEITNLFQSFMYGYYPSTPALIFEVVREDPAILGGKAIYREITIRFDGLDERPPLKMAVSLFIPKNVAKPTPLIIGINRRRRSLPSRQSGDTRGCLR